MKEKGFNINLWSVMIFVLMAVIMILFGARMQEADRLVRAQTQIEMNRRMCEKEGQRLADASDYLTNEAYHFIVTGDETHLENYWNEAREARNRDKAAETLGSLSLTEEELALVDRAKHNSDRLMEGEAWAMRLRADSLGMDREQMPERIRDVLYENGEESLSSAQKQELAAGYIFGKEYTSAKEGIKRDITSFRRLLRERKEAELEETVRRTGDNLSAARYLMIGLILTFCLESILFYCLIIRPFSHYTRTLGMMDGEGFAALMPMGARETRGFARAFNRIYGEWREQTRRLEKERYRFHVALENTCVIVYEYDVDSDTYSAFGSLEDLPEAGDRLRQEYTIDRFMDKHVLDIMGQPGFSYFRAILECGAWREAELQFDSMTGGGRKFWVKITGTPVQDESHKVTRVIGKITNIQSEKEKEFALEDARSRDGLTGLYKRAAGIGKVREYLAGKSPDEECALMLLDMDGFREINEKEGQVFADAILQDAADVLRTLTAPEDILVRLGGDEFMLFIGNCPRDRAGSLGAELAGNIHELTAGCNPDLEISASIGICMTSVTDEYSGLYRCAESTLKYAKEHGKGQAAFYMETYNEVGRLLTQIYPQSHTINKIDRPDVIREDLTVFALDLLGKSRNLDDAILLLLARVGKVCGLDRILIVEMDSGYLSCRPMYQWIRRPSDRLPEKPRYITQEELEAIYRAYDADGLCQQRIITSRTHMESILHAAIWNYGQCVGAMSFEVAQAHSWTQAERRLLSELTKIISSFILKARADAVSRAKTDFLSRMSHEIRTPMNAITGMTIIAKAVPDNPAKTMDCLNKIEAANRYLLNLINDVLDMSRIESGRLEIHPAPVNIDRIVENLDFLIRPQASEKGIGLWVDNQFAMGPAVYADELRLNQILVNLLGNAVKFTERGGTITLRIWQEQQSERETVLHFSVSDTGIGISREAQGRIFNAFEQADSDTSSNYGGTGLGLTISSRLVQLMGGSLEVDSRPGQGSVFFFAIPLPYAQNEEKKLTEQAGQDETVFHPEGKRLLLAEDNEMNREIAKEILEMSGFSVETAVNGMEAVERFAGQCPGYYDAILMDIRMPVMDGMEAARRIRTLGRPDSRTVPIIAMTANAFDEDMKKSLRNGMDSHLSKPIEVDVLLKTLGQLIGAREHI